MLFSRRAQTIMEYTMLIAIVATAVIVMTPRVRRTTQSMIKTAADQIGDQRGAEQTFNDIKVGYMNTSITTVATLIDNTRQDRMWSHPDLTIEVPNGGWPPGGTHTVVVPGTAIDAQIRQTFNETTTTNTAEWSLGGWSEQ